MLSSLASRCVCCGGQLNDSILVWSVSARCSSRSSHTNVGTSYWHIWSSSGPKTAVRPAMKCTARYGSQVSESALPLHNTRSQHEAHSMETLCAFHSHQTPLLRSSLTFQPISTPPSHRYLRPPRLTCDLLCHLFSPLIHLRLPTAAAMSSHSYRSVTWCVVLLVVALVCLGCVNTVDAGYSDPLPAIASGLIDVYGNQPSVQRGTCDCRMTPTHLGGSCNSEPLWNRCRNSRPVCGAIMSASGSQQIGCRCQCM